MLESYAVGLVVLVAVALGWAAVQSAWSRAFPDPGADPDVLARRSDCHGCGCGLVCRRRLSGKVREETEP